VGVYTSGEGVRVSRGEEGGAYISKSVAHVDGSGGINSQMGDDVS